MAASPVALAIMSTLRWKNERYDSRVIAVTRRFRQVAGVSTRSAVLRGLLAQSVPASVREIIQATAADYGVTGKDILSRSRANGIGAIRHEAILRVHEQTGISSVAIGRHLGLDHTTVLYALKQALFRRQARAA